MEMVRAERDIWNLVAGVLAALAMFGYGHSSLAAPPDFRFDVRPILAKNCFSCHGPDEAHRQADLRLDERTAAIDSGAIVPGSPNESELVRRITSDDPEERMPPPKSGRHLTDFEIELLRSWIADGAKYA